MKGDIILKTANLTKSYVLGNHRSAKKAQRVIYKLHKRYEKSVSLNMADTDELLNTLKKAQELFADENYLESYELITGKKIKEEKKPKGTVVHALNGVDVEIKKGELVAIVGPSGSGKSTLLNMIGLLDEPTSGQIFLRDKNVASIGFSKLPPIRSKELGFVFQSFNLVPTLTAIENVMIPLRYAGVPVFKRKKMAAEILQEVGLGDRLNHTPNELSGGQRQRVAIARALVNKPSIIFGDELTGELDSKTTQEIMDLILKLNKQGQTFIIVTHNNEVAKMCSRIIEMKDGKVVSH